MPRSAGAVLLSTGGRGGAGRGGAGRGAQPAASGRPVDKTKPFAVPGGEAAFAPPLRRLCPRVRAPVAAPSAASTWEDELWRIKTFYELSGDFDVEDQAEGSRVVRLTHHCTDPDWQAVNWAPDGLRLELSAPAGYPEVLTASSRPSLRILGPEGLPQRFVDLVPRLFEESVGGAQPSTPAAYRALQHLDRHLAPLYLKLREAARRAEEEREEAAARAEAAAEAQRAKAAAAAKDAASAATAASEAKQEVQVPAAPWTEDEQSRLEEALIAFRDEVDVKRRWQLIAQRVGGDRSARDCAERFRVCRELALGKAPADAPAAAAAAAAPPAAAPAPAATGWSAEEVRRQGAEVRLVGLCLDGLSTLLLRTLRLEVVCGRCRKPTDLSCELGVRCGGAATDPRSAAMPCPVCKQELAIRVAPSICHGGCPSVAHVLGVNCHPIQMLRSDVEASCGRCTKEVCIRNLGPGYKRRAECTECFEKFNLAVEGADVLGQAVAQWRQVASEEGERLNARKQLQDARRHERELGIEVGQPLPNNGTCKHYSKSYRWLRFPCCGRAFPCDACHDDQMDHIHEWANRMLCGKCSYEQPFSKDSCSYCGAAQTRARSAYWEGGTGCRNQATMSNKDSHKYKGLGKTHSMSTKANARRSPT